MKRYFLFTGYHYYPAGGMDDCEGNFDTMTECMQAFSNLVGPSGRDWWHVLDTHTGGLYRMASALGCDLLEWAADIDAVNHSVNNQ